jgi:hypothetical protein
MEPHQPPPSGLPIILGLGLFGAVLIACLMSLLGPALLYVVLVGGGLALVGGLHYWLWGQAVQGDSQSAEQQENE